MPAPESTHAVAAAIEHAERAKQTRTETVIVVLITGHAHFDLSAYESFRDGGIHDEVVTDQQLDAASCPSLPDVSRAERSPVMSDLPLEQLRPALRGAALAPGTAGLRRGHGRSTTHRSTAVRR